MDGTAAQLVSLEFDKQIIYAQPPYVVIEYARNGSIPCLVRVDANRVALKGQSKLEGDVFSQAVTISRAAADGLQFASPLTAGSITFFEYSKTPGDAIVGEFHALFSDSRTLTGSFSANLQSQR